MLQIIKIIPALKRLNTSDLFLKLTIIALIVIIVLIIKIIHIFHLLILKYEGNTEKFYSYLNIFDYVYVYCYI
ncbi:hypothetical protein IMAU10031_00769 [Lactobacillus helveticus]|nr:hypothetical protein [Lactobacillus helveticus]NRO38884.1 hypothetical protein [Lactobacillus helveticus]NRO75907.1 hypothetical protein [Lactobacillus helveticus]